MELADAKNLLLLHSFGHPDQEHPTMSGGFVGSLRQYMGLNLDNFHEVMAAIVGVAPHLVQERYIDREIVDALWSLCWSARNRGLDPNGMLQRDCLIDDEDVDRLESWIEAIEWAVLTLLNAAPDATVDQAVDAALASYREITGLDFPPES